MSYLKKNWLWLVVNLVVSFALLTTLSNLRLEIGSDGLPNVLVERTFEPSDSYRDRELLAESPTGPAERPPRSPYGFLIHVTGEWAIRLLVLSLLCTPICILFGWRQILTIKKSTGLWAFTYAGLHLLFFALDEGWLATFSEFNFIVGTLSLVIMLLLAMTSNEWSMRWLQQNWKLLHRAAYAAGVLAVLHVAILGEGSAILYTGLLMIGFGLRMPAVRKAISNYRHDQHQAAQPV